MLLGFKTQLKITSPQTREILAQHCGVARHAYNWGLWLTKNILTHNKNNPEDKIKFPSAIDLHKWLVALVKPKYDWYYSVSKCAPQYALRHLRQGWDCFQKTAGVPRFKKKYKNDSFTLDGAIHVDHFQIKLPRIGLVKTYERLPQGVKPKSVTISRKADKWYISFKVEIKPVKTHKPPHKPIDVVGVDLGILALATCSTGKVFEGIRAFKQLEKKLAELQWKNRHKQKKSNNWYKAQTLIARLHQRIANLRKDYLHKMTTYLAKNHSIIVIENLNVSGMLKNHKLSKAISDGAFYEIRRQLTYKCELYGSKLILADRFYPSSKKCNCCHEINPHLTLWDRVFECKNCGWKGDRDYNASKNLEQLGRAAPEVTPVDLKTPRSKEKAGNKAERTENQAISVSE